MKKILNNLNIRTDNFIDLNIEIAGLGSRIISYMIDFFFKNAILSVFIVGIIVFNKYTSMEIIPDANDTITYFVIFKILSSLFNFVYFTVFEVLLYGRSPGKKLTSLRVINRKGGRAGTGEIVIRNLFRAIDELPLFYFTGIIFIMLTKKEQRLGDIIAGTIVIREANFKDAKQ